MQQGDNAYYGIYRGVCKNVKDPQKRNRIEVTVPQILGPEKRVWADPCLPVSSNTDHPDHLAHTAAQVAALLTSHSISGTTEPGGSPSHTHSFSATAAHSGNSGKLTHSHGPVTDPIDKLSSAEHTPHHKIPKINQGVWVMFEGGDINFPVWMGVY